MGRVDDVSLGFCQPYAIVADRQPRILSLTQRNCELQTCLQRSSLQMAQGRLTASQFLKNRHKCRAGSSVLHVERVPENRLERYPASFLSSASRWKLWAFAATADSMCAAWVADLGACKVACSQRESFGLPSCDGELTPHQTCRQLTPFNASDYRCRKHGGELPSTNPKLTDS